MLKRIDSTSLLFILAMTIIMAASPILVTMKHRSAQVSERAAITTKQMQQVRVAFLLLKEKRGVSNKYDSKAFAQWMEVMIDNKMLNTAPISVIGEFSIVVDGDTAFVVAHHRHKDICQKYAGGEVATYQGPSEAFLARNNMPDGSATCFAEARSGGGYVVAMAIESIERRAHQSI